MSLFLLLGLLWLDLLMLDLAGAAGLDGAIDLDGAAGLAGLEGGGVRNLPSWLGY